MRKLHNGNARAAWNRENNLRSFRKSPLFRKLKSQSCGPSKESAQITIITCTITCSLKNYGNLTCGEKYYNSHISILVGYKTKHTHNNKKKVFLNLNKYIVLHFPSSVTFQALVFSISHKPSWRQYFLNCSSTFPFSLYFVSKVSSCEDFGVNEFFDRFINCYRKLTRYAEHDQV